MLPSWSLRLAKAVERAALDRQGGHVLGSIRCLTLFSVAVLYSIPMFFGLLLTLAMCMHASTESNLGHV